MLKSAFGKHEQQTEHPKLGENRMFEIGCYVKRQMALTKPPFIQLIGRHENCLLFT